MEQRSVTRRIFLVGLAAVLTAATFLPVSPAAATTSTTPSTSVLNWNATAVAAIFNLPTATPPGAGQAPTVGVIHMAMVQGAVYDAVNSIVGGHEPYLHVPCGASLGIDRCRGRDGGP